MTPLEGLAVVAAGVGAGGINAVVGSGSLITFPTLLAVGLPSVTANVSNNIGLVPGSASSVYGYRRELVGQGRRARLLACASAAGGVVGATLLLTLPSSVFDAVVPILVLVACGLMLAQPRLSAYAAKRRGDAVDRDVTPAAWAIVFVGGVYGGYFGAGQGVILLAVLAVLLPDDLKRTNALKNVLAGTVNGLAAVIFVVVAHVDWVAVALVAVGAVVGGAVGARIGRRIPPVVLRGVVVAIGVVVAAKLLLT